jgi:hypothetical protein
LKKERPIGQKDEKLYSIRQVAEKPRASEGIYGEGGRAVKTKHNRFGAGSAEASVSYPLYSIIQLPHKFLYSTMGFFTPSRKIFIFQANKRQFHQPDSGRRY